MFVRATWISGPPCSPGDTDWVSSRVTLHCFAGNQEHFSACFAAKMTGVWSVSSRQKCETDDNIRAAL